MLFYEWTDFVVYPLGPDRVRSMAERRDLSAALQIEDPPSNSSGAVVNRTLVLEGDLFECMEISEDGQVTIWTRDKVWFLTREGTGRCIENLRYVPRNPPEQGRV